MTDPPSITAVNPVTLVIVTLYNELAARVPELVKKSRNAPATQESYSKPLFVRHVRHRQIQRFLCSFEIVSLSFFYVNTFINYDV